MNVRAWVCEAVVLHDGDVTITDEGVGFPWPRPVVVSWLALTEALTPPVAGLDGPARAARWITGMTWLLSMPDVFLAETARVVGIPVGRPSHPGPGWVTETVLGGALDLGTGFVGADPTRPDTAVVLPAGVTVSAGSAVAALWPMMRLRHEKMGELAALRFADGSTRGRLRSMGGHDVVTLLGTATLRRAIAGQAPHGMAIIAVPSRKDGWVISRLVDPAFAVTVAGAVSDAEVGFSAPILVTADELVQPPVGGNPRLALGRGR